MSEYFKELFSSFQAQDWSEMLHFIKSAISTQHNEILLAPISEEEVRKALFQMKADKV